MTWVRRTEPKPRAPIHTCAAPFQSGRASLLPDGRPGDLWRCDTCRKLWRIAPTGQPVGAYEWRPARWWQRLRYPDRPKWRQGPDPGTGLTGQTPPGGSVNTPTSGE